MLLCPWKNQDKWVSTGSSEHPAVKEKQHQEPNATFSLFLSKAVIGDDCIGSFLDSIESALIHGHEIF